MTVTNDKEFMFSQWEYNGKLIKIPHQQPSYAIYSKNYNCIVVMNYERKGEVSIYNSDGKITDSFILQDDDIYIQYITGYPQSKSNIAIVGSHSKETSAFQDWHFELDLDNKKIGKRLTPAY